MDKIVEACHPFGKAGFCLVKYEGVDLMSILCHCVLIMNIKITFCANLW